MQPDYSALTSNVLWNVYSCVRACVCACARACVRACVRNKHSLSLVRACVRASVRACVPASMCVSHVEKYVCPRVAQALLLVLGLAQIYVGVSTLPEKLMRITPTTTCAVVRVTPHSLRNGQPVFTSINATDWVFGLSLNKCSVPGGKISEQGTARVLTFSQPIHFNEFF